MDLLRGTSILLVIITHTVLFAYDGGPGVPDFIVFLDNVFAPVRMPLMVFLSGMLVTASLNKGARLYLVGKGRRVLYPYLVWGIIGVTLDGLISYSEGRGFQFADYLRIFYAPVTLTWFLAYLTIFYVIACLMKKIPDLAMVSASLALCAATPNEWHRFFFLLAFFMLGKWCSEHADTLETTLVSTKALIACSIISTSLVIVGIFGLGSRLTYEAISLPVVLAAFVLAIRAARTLQGLRVLDPIKAVGRNSIIYYLAHWHGVAAGMRVARLIAPDQQWAFFAFGVAGSLLASVVLHWANGHVPGAKLLFSLPARKQLVREGLHKTG